MKNPETTTKTVVRGRCANLLLQGSNIAVLDPDVVEHFPDSESVNNALRASLAIGKQVESASGHAPRKTPRAATSKSSINFDPRKGSLKTRVVAK
jgi:hypothetical protein